MTDTNQSVVLPEGDAGPNNTMTPYVVADADGRIRISGRVPAFMISTQPVATGQQLVQGEATVTGNYVLNGAIAARPANPSMLSGMTISAVPAGANVSIDDGIPQVCNDGEVQLSFAYPGTYHIVVSAWPALDAVFEVTQS